MPAGENPFPTLPVGFARRLGRWERLRMVERARTASERTQRGSIELSASAVMPAVGLAAPRLTLPASKLAPMGGVEAGRPALLVFYRHDWCPACEAWLLSVNQLLDSFTEQGVSVYGVSVDSLCSHRAFGDRIALRFPLLADFEPKGAASRAYHMYDEVDGCAKRGLTLVDASGIIRYACAGDPGQHVSEALQILKDAP